MEPKFQSSFIPKGPLGSSGPGSSGLARRENRSLLSFLGLIIFTLSVVLAIGVFGYKFYLKYHIKNMGTALEEARTSLQPETIDELTRLDNRIISTKELVAAHRILSPLFEFLETSTPKTVRFSDFRYQVVGSQIELFMKGEARGYSVLAFQADIFNKSDYFKNPVFSDLSLNDKGDVVFSFTATLDPKLLSYSRQLESTQTPAPEESLDLMEGELESMNLDNLELQ